MYLPLKRGTYTISSGFGMRWGTMHNGMDFAAPIGTPIYAPFDAKVIQGKDRAPGTVSGFGNWVWLEGIEEPFDFIVGHVPHSSILVRAGDRVRAGQKIAEVGNEGQSTGPHAHCELWTRPGRIGGRAIDPARYWNAGALNPGGSVAPRPAGGSGTIFGIDISEHQDGLALSRAKADGIEFVILRLCDGTHADRTFRSHLADAERNGLLTSTYWYLRAPSEGTSISQQVDVIDRQLGGRKDLGVWIDVESVAPDGRKLLTGADVREAKRELERRGYHVPGIYSGAWYWESMPGGEPSMRDLGYLWVSHYGRNRSGAPQELYQGDGGSNHRGWRYPLGDRLPDILQFGSNGRVGGWHPVDVNAFRGTREELANIFHPKHGSKKSNKGESTVTFKQFTDFVKGYFGPQIDALQEVWRQLRGPGGTGWPQLGQNQQGQNLTLVDGVAAVRQDIAALRRDMGLDKGE